MKHKILVVAPYGMTLRQVVLNKELWEYLCNKYEVHIKTSIEIEEYKKLGIEKIIIPEKSIVSSLLHKVHNLSKTSKILNFLIENNLGEHLVFRLKYIENFSKELCKSYFFNKVLASVKLFSVDNFKSYLAMRVSQVKKEKYLFILVTHISEPMCELESIAANKINIPVITYTLGMDNFRHGRILFRPDLMLMWGNEHKYEFSNWHRNDFNSIDDIKCEIVGNLIYDTYLQHANNNKLEQYVKNKKSIDYEGYIVVPTMINSILPGGIDLVRALIKYIIDRKLNYLIIVRTLPGSDDQKNWQQLEEEHMKEILIYEPSVGSFDKRGALNNFKIEDELKEVEIFSAMLSKSSMVVNLYPSSVTLDAYLFDTPVLFPSFDWINPQNKKTKEHPFNKILFSTFPTQPYQKEFNLLPSYKELFKAMDNIIKGHSSKYIGKNLFKEVCGSSKDMNVGKRTIKAIEDFITPYV